MAFGPRNIPDTFVGMFTEKDCGNYFEYSMADDFVLYPDMKTGRNTEYPHKVWVCEPWKHDQGWRRALVKKTVAYIVVDEADDGSAVIEKWYIKDHNEYYTDNKPLTPGSELLSMISG
jgi:hypothetical protein